MIPQKNISTISNLTSKDGGKKIPETVIERDYCLSWFLFGISSSKIKDLLIFKGGTALRRCHFVDYRFSEDLDFTLSKEISLDDILKEFKNIYSWVQDESGIIFQFAKKEESSHNTHTLYLSYVGPLPGSAKEVKVDITFKETIVTPIEEMGIIKTYNEYYDFLADSKIMVYSLEEIAIEKICALFAHDRKQPRDLFDIYNLIEEKNVKVADLVNLVEMKLNFKNIRFESIKSNFEKKEAVFEKMWAPILGQQMSFLPPFQEVFRKVKKSFRQAGLLDKD